MKKDRHEKLKISNNLLDAMLVWVKTQEDLWDKEGIITQLNKTLLKEAILSLYAKVMTTRNIQATLQDLYHVDVSPSLISKVTDVVNEEVEQWRNRPLEAVYPVV